MALKTDRKTLTTEIKQAVKNGRNFVYAPSGGATNPDVLMLSKKKISPSEHKIAKSGAGAAKVYFGSCIKEGSSFIFRCAKKPPETLGKRIKKSIKELTDFPPPKVVAIFAEGLVELNIADNDDLKEMAMVRRKSIVAAVKWVGSAKPESSATIIETMRDGHRKFDSEDWQDAIDSYDQTLSAVAEARKAMSKTKIGESEPEPTGLKRKKLGKEYVGEDKQMGWRAQELTDKEVSDRAILKLAHQSATYKGMAAGDFMNLVRGNDPEVIKMIDLLKDALARGDKATVEKISKMKAQTREDRQKLRESDKVTTEYYTPQQRKKHGLKVGKDGLLYDANGDLFDERKGFVLDPDTGNLIVFRGKVKDVGGGKKKTTHHSSPLAGGDVGGAGHIKAEDGRVRSIDDASGHYKPDASFTLQTLKQLEKLGAKLVDDTIVDEDGDEVSANKARKFKLVKAYEKERKQKLKELLTLWKRDIKLGKAKAGTPPKLQKYDPNIAAIREKLLKAGVGPSKKSTKVKLQGKTGLSQAQFDATKGDLKKVNKILKELTGKKDLLPEDLESGTLNSRPALNLKIGELLKRKLSKEQFEQTSGDEGLIRKKDVLNEEIKSKGRQSALAGALQKHGVSSVLAGASKILGISEKRLKVLSKKTHEEVLLGANKEYALKKLERIETEIEERTQLEDETLEKLNIKSTNAGIKKAISSLSTYDLEKIIDGSTREWDARNMLGLN